MSIQENEVQKIIDRYQGLNLEEMLVDLKLWAKTEAIPILGGQAEQADLRYRATRSVGRRLQKADVNIRGEIARLTDKDEMYWEAQMLEMDIGNPLLIGLKIMLHVVHGELDIAWDYVSAYRFFARKESQAADIFQGFLLRFGIFKLSFEHTLNQGISLHDAGEFSSAIAIYEKLLSIHPKSAQVLFERYKSAGALGEVGEGKLSPTWGQLREMMEEFDPLYEDVGRVKNAREAYEAALRKKANHLFDNPTQESIKTEIPHFADIAMELRDYGLAAHLYWLIHSYQSGENDDRNYVAYFMYCLNKLRVRGLVGRYKGNLAQDSRKITEFRTRNMEQHPAYKDFGMND